MNKLVMDAGYKTPGIAHLLFQDNLTPIIPYKRPMAKKGFFKKYDYVYDEYYDQYICPNMKTLTYTTTNRDCYREYKSNPHDCMTCSLINNELKRGTTTQIKENNKTRQLYFAKTGQAKYIENRKRCGANSKLVSAVDFINYACKQIIDFNWSPDAIVGFVKPLRTWDKPLVSTKTLYNYIDKGFLPVRNHHLKMKLRLSSKKKRSRKHKKELGKSIDERPSIINNGERFGHWEIDSVIGAKSKDDNALLTLVERKTRYMITVVLDDHTEESVCYAVNRLKSELGQASFSKMFQSITADNGSEFSSLHDALQQITDVYFAHPYSSWERGTNERHNGLLKQVVPKGTPICHYSKHFIQLATEKINLLPRKILNYRQPATLFLEEIQKLKIKTCW